MFYAIPNNNFNAWDPLDYNAIVHATSLPELDKAILEALQEYEDSSDDPPPYYLILDAKKVTVTKRLVTRIPATFTLTDV